MGKSRLEAFSDGVIAIIITIMVLEIKAPKGPDLDALRPLVPVALSYLLSFVYVGIYWNNHHHMLHAAKKIDGRVLWANLHLLFWLSLVPVDTAWIGEHPFARWPTALYGVLLLASGLSYTLLQAMLIRANGKDSELAQAVGHDTKGKASAVCYTLAVALAFWRPALSYLLYALVAAMWFVPDRRIEKRVAAQPR